MRKVVVTVLAALSLSIGVVAPAAALPPVGFSVAPQEDATSTVDETRLFCYNRASGRFLHWGRCGGARAFYRAPRVYCRNRWTGRFLHWGSCWG